ncbi:MAG: hypothetical protein DRJ38_04550 [Thermoprotei archaeon]|nr:MAG: hypothetical protein DRJ38_04550 [Thermoprotei archaeon]
MMGRVYRVVVDDVTITLEVTRYGNCVKVVIRGSSDEYKLWVWDHGDIKLTKTIITEEEIEPIKGD